MNKQTEEKLNKFFYKLEFKGTGDKLSEYSKIIEILKKSKDKKISKEKVPEKYTVLINLEKKDAKEIYEKVKEKNKLAVKQYNELKTVFKEWNAKISKNKLNSIAYPEGFEIKKNGDLYSATCNLMEKWYEENEAEKMDLFRFPHHEKSEIKVLKKNKAFGFFRIKEKEYPIFRPLQVITFYKDRKKREGIKPNIKNAHLLLLFGIMKLSLKKDFDKIGISLDFHKNMTVREQSQDIEKIVREDFDRISGRDIAVFKKG
ncbi:MAG: hypothetical protein R6U26_02240 [Candidatus Undinarchaeales archaeon]